MLDFWSLGILQERDGKRRVGCSGILNTMRERVEDSPHRPDATSDEEVGWGGPLRNGTEGSPSPFRTAAALCEFSAVTSQGLKKW